MDLSDLRRFLFLYKMLLSQIKCYTYSYLRHNEANSIKPPFLPYTGGHNLLRLLVRHK